VVNENKITFTADSAYRDVKIVVEGKVEEKPNPLVIILDNMTRLILGVKNVNFTWSRTQGTSLPGFMPTSKLFGMANSNDMFAPGLEFVFGVQNKNFRQKAIDNNWLTKSVNFNAPTILTYNERITLRSTVEPFPGFKIELNASRSYTRNESSYYSAQNQTFDNPQRTGNFSISFISIGSAFQKLKAGDNFHSEVFQVFQNNRMIIADRLGKKRQSVVGTEIYNPEIYNPDGGRNGYSYTSQDVLIPAFLAAYGGKDPEKVTLNKFPSVWNMMPNWRVNYDGLSKIEFIQKVARTVAVTHSYTSTYNVGSYISNNEYDLQTILAVVRDMQNNFVPQVDISSVSITEQFGPLVGVDVTFKNSLSTKLEVRKNRNVLLSMANNQLTETGSSEVVAGAGYKINDFNLIIKNLTGNQKSYKSDLNLRADVSVRDNKTIIRRLTNEPDQPAQGQKIVTIKVSADYMLSEKFSLQAFYDRIVNTPLVSSSYPTANTNIGFSLRFSLTQ
jgi:cell surface protein SprA